jgi:hypothetical protein
MTIFPHGADRQLLSNTQPSLPPKTPLRIANLSMELLEPFFREIMAALPGQPRSKYSPAKHLLRHETPVQFSRNVHYIGRKKKY